MTVQLLVELDILIIESTEDVIKYFMNECLALRSTPPPQIISKGLDIRVKCAAGLNYF